MLIFGLVNAGFHFRSSDTILSNRPGEYYHIFVIFQSKVYGSRALEALKHLKLPLEEEKRGIWAYGAQAHDQKRDHADDRDINNHVPSVTKTRESMVEAFEGHLDRTKAQTSSEDDVGTSEESFEGFDNEEEGNEEEAGEDSSDEEGEEYEGEVVEKEDDDDI